ncbi:MAG: hypothetical protein EOO15_15190 [Chitinophagaceae bacterium]|nr:MAG: hypothetical protein EOO15_15190 [Chitinophagaceae bacterium]
MDQEQLNEIARLGKVLGHFDAHKPIWEAVAPVADSVTILTSLQRQVKLSGVVQADGTASDTRAKNMALGLTASLAYLMSRRIFAWAVKNGKISISEAVNYSQTDLDHAAEEILLQRYALILKHAEENRTELAAYKVSDASIEELKRAIATFEALRSGRDEKSGHRIFSTANIGELLTKTRETYTVLDAEVEGLIADKEFIDTYFIHRRRTDCAATRASGPDAAGA